MPCKIARTREWAKRIVDEASLYEENRFITLTYNDENYMKLGFHKSIDKKIIFNFFRRLKERKKVKYFACGEYGEKYGRPHYHAIVFNFGACHHCRVCCKPLQSKQVAPEPGTDCYLLEECWTNGFVYSGSVTYKSARYVAKYCQKQLYAYDALVWDWLYYDCNPPFAIFTKGLGKEFVLANKEYFMSKLSCKINGVDCSIPRYYKKKLDIPDDVLKNKAVEEQKRLAKKYQDLDPEEVFKKIIETNCNIEKHGLKVRELFYRPKDV